MGEESKKIGEEGQKKIRGLLESVGWLSAAEEFDFSCIQPVKHRTKKDGPNRSDHGLDFALSYVCPIIQNRRRNILISAKNSSADETVTKKGLVQKDLKDLSDALECFKYSENRKRMLQAGGATAADDIGVLIRINVDEDASRSALGPYAKRERLEIDGRFPLYLIENSRFDFIQLAMRHCKNAFDGRHRQSFALPKSALSVTADSRRSNDSMLPVQSLVAGPLAIRLDAADDDSRSTLVIYTEQEFTEDCFRRLMSLSLELTVNWVQVALVFPNFHNIKHGNIAREIIGGLEQKDFAAKIKCFSLQERTRLH